MPVIIDLTSSQPEEARARTPSPAPSIEITAVVKIEKPSPPPRTFKKEAEDEALSLPLPAAAAAAAVAASPMDDLDGRTWATFDALFLDARKAARDTGFAMIKKRPSNYLKGEPQRYDLECSEGTATGSGGKNPNAAKSRSSRSQKKDCLWKAKATCAAATKRWSFTMRHPHHCHPLDPETAAYLATNRRLDRTEDVSASIIRHARQPKTSSSDIASTLRDEFPGIKVGKQDVLNALRTDRENKSGALTPTQQFVNALSTTKGVAAFEVHREGGKPDGVIDMVFWTYDWCVEQLAKNPEVWSLDCTYKVNRFNMPLLQICGVTSLHTTFNIGYCLLSGESEECFAWALTQLKNLLAAKQIPHPSVIITDFDKACKKAMRSVFGGVQHQICLWHVMKNVAFNVKKKWVGSLEGTALGERGSDGSHLREEEVSDKTAARLLKDDDRALHLGDSVRDPQLKRLAGWAPKNSPRTWLANADGILAAWRAVVYADKEEKFWQEWETLKREFSDQPDIISYLLNTYLPMRHEFMHFAIKAYPNFGIRVTSRTEGAHGVLKALLKNRRIHLNQLLDAIEETLSRLKENYQAKYSTQVSKKVIEYSHDIFNKLRYLTSFAALDLIARQLKFAEEAIVNKRVVTDCSGDFRVQFGLPCWHEILQFIRVNKDLELEHIDRHWHLKPKEPLSEEFLRIRRERDPKTVLNKRQQYALQVKNGNQPVPDTPSSSVRCDPSHDAPQRPAKKAKTTRMTATQAVIQTQADLQGIKDVASSLLQNVQTLTQRQAQLERELMAARAPPPPPQPTPEQWLQDMGWGRSSQHSLPPSSQQQGFSFQPAIPSQHRYGHMAPPSSVPAQNVYQRAHQSPLVQLSAQSQIQRGQQYPNHPPQNPPYGGWHQ